MILSREAAALAEHRAVELHPNDAGCWHSLAVACFDAELLGDAERCCCRVTEIDPRHVKALTNLGAILQRRGAREDAERHYRKAIAAEPGVARARFDLAMLLLERGAAQNDAGRPLDARASLEEALWLAPDSAPANEQLAGSLLNSGDAAAAVGRFRRAAELDPTNRTVASNLLFALNYVPDADPEAIFGEHLAWRSRHFPAGAPGKHANDADPGRRIRVGYLSPDFREHALAYFIEPALSRHDPAQFDVICYSDVGAGDSVTQRLRGIAARWRDSSRLDAGALTAQVRGDQVDILVDLAGHSQGGRRIALLAMKPAPVQASWLGYLNTTALPAMDYRITDGNACPEGWERYHTERLARLPASQWCYAADARAPEVGPLPADRAGHLTFASMHNQAKVSTRVISLWSSLLHKVPGSRPLMLAPGIEQTSRKFIEQFLAHGVDPARVEFKGRVSIAEYFALHNRVDINLDAFPYTGGTTTCHSLWMGVPVVTLKGNTVTSRGGASLLGAMGLLEFAAENEAQYLDIAAGLANDLPRLGRMRRELRARMAQSPLMDAAGFTRDLESAYRAMWRSWCAARGQ